MKQYIKPQLQSYAVNSSSILAGSLEAKSGSTSQQLSKSRNISGLDFEEDVEE